MLVEWWLEALTSLHTSVNRIISHAQRVDWFYFEF